MSVLQFTNNLTGDLDVAPHIVRIASTDSYATITAANYLIPLISQGLVVAAGDLVLINYGLQSNTVGLFTVGISGSTVTLSPFVGQAVTLPVVDGDVAIFNGTLGVIEDSGILSTNVQLKTNIQAGTKSFAGGSTSTTQAITGLTASSIVVATIAAATNACTVRASAGTNLATFTFSADPGAATVVAWVAFLAAQ